MRQFLLMFLLAMKVATATPFVYTFTGNIGGASSDVIDDRNQSGLMYSNGIRYNSEIEYRVLIDFDRMGEIINVADGTNQEVNYSLYPQYEFFYAAYEAGNPFTDLYHGTYYIPGDSAGSYTPPTSKSAVNTGLNDLNLHNSRMLLYIDEWTSLTIRSDIEFAQDWKVGDAFTSVENVQNPLFVEHPASLGVTLYLKNISPASVPEPNSSASLLIGCILLAINGIKLVFQRRISKK